jgi:hypothetical protein
MAYIYYPTPLIKYKYYCEELTKLVILEKVIIELNPRIGICLVDEVGGRKGKVGNSIKVGDCERL